MVGLLFFTTACSSKASTISNSSHVLTAQEVNHAVDRMANTPGMKYVSELAKDSDRSATVPNIIMVSKGDCSALNIIGSVFYLFDNKPNSFESVRTLYSNLKVSKKFSIEQITLGYADSEIAKQSLTSFEKIFKKCSLKFDNNDTNSLKHFSNFKDYKSLDYMEWKTHLSQTSMTFRGVKLFKNYIMVNSLNPYNYSNYLGYLEGNHQLMNVRIG